VSISLTAVLTVCVNKTANTYTCQKNRAQGYSIYSSNTSNAFKMEAAGAARERKFFCFSFRFCHSFILGLGSKLTTWVCRRNVGSWLPTLRCCNSLWQDEKIRSVHKYFFCFSLFRFACFFMMQIRSSVEIHFPFFALLEINSSSCVFASGPVLVFQSTSSNIHCPSYHIVDYNGSKHHI